MVALPSAFLYVPPGNVFLPRSWNPMMHSDNFLFLTLYPYIMRLVYNILIVPNFVVANPIGQPWLGPEDPLPTTCIAMIS